MHGFCTLFLLPLREKVSAKPTDEGSMNAKAAPSLSTGRGFERLRNPSSDLLRRPPSPARGEGSGRAEPFS